MLPYGHQSISEEDIQAVVDVLKGEWLTTGPFVNELESALSKLAGGHPTVSCTSGTAALHIAYAALGIGPGDEVISTPMTFVATTSGASILGAKIVFADVEEDTALLDPASVEAVISERTRVIAAVDYAGHPADYDALQLIAQKYSTVVLDDAAHSIGGTYKGRPVGDLADITTFSFFPTKTVTTAEGGAVACKNEETALRAREFHQIGMVRDSSRFQILGQGAWHQEVHSFGLNYRLSDVACALGLSQLHRLMQFKARRAELTSRYNRALQNVDGVRIPSVHDNVDPAWHLYPIRVLDGQRRKVFDRMRAAGIGVQVNYMPVYWHPVYQDLGYKRGMCPNAERFYEEELSLPLFPDLTNDQLDQVIEVLCKALK